jgi:hypothetical protein
VNRDELERPLALIDRAIERGQLTIEQQRLLIENEASAGRDQTDAPAVLTRLLKAQRKLEDNRDELSKSIKSGLLR